MKESEIPKLNSVFWTASPCPMFIRKDWKSLWIVQSETTVDVTVLCNGCILPEHRALLSTHCMTGSPPPPKTRWIAWAAATSLVPVCPAPSPQQIWPHSLPSSAQLSTALWGCLWLCPPSFCVPFQTKYAASAAQMPHAVPACLTWEQLGGILACTCLFTCHRDSLRTFPNLLLSSSPAV